MSLYLTGTFTEKVEAIAAIKGLKANGYGVDDLTVFSDEPIEFPRGVLDRPSKMSLVVVLSAIAFFLTVIAFVRFTQYDYKLRTGGMPLFSPWPTAVVFYEVTMAGAVLTTVVWFIWESGLFRRDKNVPLPRIEPEVICLRVRCSSDDKLSAAAALLEKSGATSVGKLERTK